MTKHPILCILLLKPVPLWLSAEQSGLPNSDSCSINVCWINMWQGDPTKNDAPGTPTFTSRSILITCHPKHLFTACHFSSSVDFWYICLHQSLRWKFHHSYMLFEFFLVFVRNRFYGWLVMWIAAFSLMGTYLNFAGETCFSHQLCHEPRVGFVFHLNIPRGNQCMYFSSLLSVKINSWIIIGTNVWALAFPILWFHTSVTMLGHTSD